VRVHHAYRLVVLVDEVNLPDTNSLVDPKLAVVSGYLESPPGGHAASQPSPLFPIAL